MGAKRIAEAWKEEQLDALQYGTELSRVVASVQDPEDVRMKGEPSNAEENSHAGEVGYAVPVLVLNAWGFVTHQLLYPGVLPLHLHRSVYAFTAFSSLICH